MRAAILLLALGACTAEVVAVPVMAPVDRPRPPRDTGKACEDPDFDPIDLPTTAGEQIAGRRADRAVAAAAIDRCDRRRGAAVRILRRLGFDL
ncbi:MAG: hypothetical protein ACRC67_30195 [Inquilinus sp.]|uniref:hypothetical protein n=1 Tax=Inquilinus sp. TaxID=1932117 RepID=UPI003F30352A